MLVAALMLAVAAPQDFWADAGTTRGLVLPPGPAAAALAGVLPDTVATHLPAWPALDDPAWHADEPWRRWLVAVRGAAGGDPSARAELAALAALGGRSDAAWGHLAQCGERPELVAALVPRFCPGASTAGPLPDGVLLAPLLPPPTPGLAPGQIDRRSMQISGLWVGAAELALRVMAEPDGVQIDVKHLSGGSARVRVRIPCPPDLEMRVEYADWERRDTVGEPIEIALAPGDEVHTLWGRALPLRPTWPVTLPDALPAGVRAAGLAIATTCGDPERARLAALARTLAALLDVPAAVRLHERAGAGELTALVLDLRPGRQRERKLAALMTLAERFALSRGERDAPTPTDRGGALVPHRQE